MVNVPLCPVIGEQMVINDVKKNSIPDGQVGLCNAHDCTMLEGGVRDV